MKTKDQPIIVEEIFETSVKKVWEALTEADQMDKWFFEQIESFVPKEGFSTAFLIEIEDRRFTHLWKVIEVKVNSKGCVKNKFPISAKRFF